MGKLHDRMEADLKLRGLSPKTQRSYLSCARQFAKHYHRSPAEMGEPEITGFLRHLVQDRQAAAPTIHMYVAAFRFLYKVTLQRPEAVGNVAFLAHEASLFQHPASQGPIRYSITRDSIASAAWLAGALWQSLLVSPDQLVVLLVLGWTSLCVCTLAVASTWALVSAGGARRLSWAAVPAAFVGLAVAGAGGAVLAALAIPALGWFRSQRTRAAA